MGRHHQSDLLVVEERDSERRVVGVLGSSDVNAIYDSQLAYIGTKRRRTGLHGLLARLRRAGRGSGRPDEG